MDFSLEDTVTLLGNTPTTISSLLSGISTDWIHQNEGEGTWSPFDVVGHLIHGEKTDWIPRTKIILFEEDKRFIPFDRFAQEEESKGKTI
ncbi:MAG: DinB family protein, partial [Bacteroidota bacterium]